MAKKIFLFVALILLSFLLYVYSQPSDFRIQRSIVIKAPAEIVFSQLNDFHKWEAWSPWAKIDPQARNTFSGPDSGQGAIFSWSGNDEVGEGQMTIIESLPYSLIRIELLFSKPMVATNQTEFFLSPADGGITLNWSMSGQNSFICKVMCFFIDMDKMVGEQFEKGLQDIKAISETRSATIPPPLS